MGREQSRPTPVSEQRVDDEEACRGRLLLPWMERDRLFEPDESCGERLGISGQPGSSRISLILAGTRDTELDQTGRQRRLKRHEQP